MQSLLILMFLFINLSPGLIVSNPVIKFPCKPPLHNSYPFCNTTLSIKKRALSLVSSLTLEEKIQQLSNNASSISRLGIPAYEWWSESLHGIAANGPGITFDGVIKKATLFPQVILSAASFNRSLWRDIASAVAVEARAMFNVGQAGLTFWAPNINIFRDPRWGRGQETPGEDPMVVSEYSVEYVKGFQGEDLRGVYGVGERRILKNGNFDDGDEGGERLMLSACCKHYAAYDLEKWREFARYNFNAVVTKQDMEDTYQPPFRSCIQQGKASCLMCSYNAINGVPACANKELLQKARVDWGFEGYITSDCDAVATIYEYQNYTKTEEDAVAIAIRAGTDINCGTYMKRHMKSAFDQGKVLEEDIDKALFNLFIVQLRLGLFDGNPAKRQFGKLGPHDVCTSKHKDLALDAVRQGIVLLKNDKGFLPFDKNKISSLAVIGPMANRSDLGGGYSGVPCNQRSILDGLQEYVKKMYYATGCENVQCNSSNGLVEASAAAKVAEFVLVVAGLDLSQETEDLDRYSLLLPGYQMSLISSLAAVSKKPLILVLTGGGPIDVSFAESDPRIASIIWIGYPGEMGGKALSEIIFGGYNPGGRLPVTWYPDSFTRVPMTDMNMRADPSHGYPGRTYRFYTGHRVYGFGHGLSYTTFTYSIVSAPDKLSLLGLGSINIESQRSSGAEHIHVEDIANCHLLKFYVQISVTNNGGMDGGKAVLIFSRTKNEYKHAPKKTNGLIRFTREAISVEQQSTLVDPSASTLVS
ncbi:hypothetical protein Leryth_006676 [Lithospermum erythrorhizon]|nr:hypothetical protein Leryth_006676 [Lithospermum erythrorhizon]